MYDFIKDDFHYKEDVIILRGFIINKAISIEVIIDRLIVFYYHKDDPLKGNKFHDDILRHTNWQPKMVLLKKVLLHFDTDEVIKSRKKLFKLLKAIIDLRNSVAHHQWSRIWKDGVHFKSKKLISEFHISEKLVSQYIDDCIKATTILNVILDEIGYFEHLVNLLKNEK